MDGCSLGESQPFSASNGACGVLVLHGFTGSPQSMRPLAEAFADAGYSVELPLLPGHGTTVSDLATKTFEDFKSAADAAYCDLSARTDRTLVAGLSMGGSLALSLARHHSDLAGLILINPLVAPPAPVFLDLLHSAVSEGVSSIPSIGGDVMANGIKTGGYDATPVASLASLMSALDDIAGCLSEVVCPTLLFSSRTDHVVPTASSDLVEAEIGGPLERIVLENSFHVATLDNDAAEIEERSVSFAAKICGR